MTEFKRLEDMTNSEKLIAINQRITILENNLRSYLHQTFDDFLQRMMNTQASLDNIKNILKELHTGNLDYD